MTHAITLALIAIGAAVALLAVALLLEEERAPVDGLTQVRRPGEVDPSGRAMRRPAVAQVQDDGGGGDATVH